MRLRDVPAMLQAEASAADGEEQPSHGLRALLQELEGQGATDLLAVFGPPVVVHDLRARVRTACTFVAGASRGMRTVQRRSAVALDREQDRVQGAAHLKRAGDLQERRPAGGGSPSREDQGRQLRLDAQGHVGDVALVPDAE